MNLRQDFPDFEDGPSVAGVKVTEGSGQDEAVGSEEVEVEKDDNSDSDECEEEGRKKGGAKTRVRVSIYKKVLAIRELDRLIEAGHKVGLEKKVMQKFPELFMGLKGSFKSGMLGRWLVQCDEQRWRDIPWERMSQEDREMKELPDWIRLPFGMTPRNLDRFKSGTHVPPVVVQNIISSIEKLTCGGDQSRLTCGTVDTKAIKLECEELMKVYSDSQAEEAKKNGLKLPKQKAKVSERWVNRLLQHYGWKRHTPNTYGAYLDYDDERMKRSRKCWYFLRPFSCVGKLTQEPGEVYKYGGKE